ncbi:MAG: hypothetical protein DGJ47_000786 [Rickettsiaceae bacterium]
MSKKIKIVLHGASGRMGLKLQTLITKYTNQFELIGLLTSESTQAQKTKLCKDSDLIIDFSTPEGFNSLLQAMSNITGCALLTGTTGLDQKQYKMIGDCSKNNIIMYAPNTSITANLVAELSSKAARILHDFDAEIIESHHRHKKDAPSGTAIMIGQKIAKARGLDFDQNAVYGRHGESMRQEGEIGFSAVRAGGIYGDNKVILANEYEVLNIGCSAINRDAFADGALKAGKWLINQPYGLYSMTDFLKL